jgi:integrase
MQNDPTISQLLPGFFDYMTVEWRFSPVTVTKYQDNVRWFIRDVGDLRLTEIGLEHFITLKVRMCERGACEARVANVIAAMKALLAYARDIHRVQILDLARIVLPRSPRREVTYLTNEELEKFLSAIFLRTWLGKPRLAGYRFRAIVETLAANPVNSQTDQIARQSLRSMTGFIPGEPLSLRLDRLDVGGHVVQRCRQTAWICFQVVEYMAPGRHPRRDVCRDQARTIHRFSDTVRWKLSSVMSTEAG